jgi:hypothetical protein
MKGSTKIIASLILIGLVALIGFRMTGNVVAGPGEYDSFAKCVTDSGAKMYGAYWCPHCANQKKAFGNSFDLIDYIECDPRGDGAQPQLCQLQGVQGYPTWIFGDQTRLSGEVPLPQLATKTGCVLPE